MLIIFTVLLFVLGLVFGSFFNVLIWRLPRKQSIVAPRSHCPKCKSQLSLFELIPVISFLLQKGRCRHCKAKISLEYPVIELLTAIGFVFFGLLTTTWLQLLANLFFFSCLLVSAVIDLHHKLILDVITIPGIALALVFSLLEVTVPINLSLLGILIGGGLLLAMAVISKGGMGMGDVKFLAMIGGFLGPYGAMLSLVIASFLGAVIGMIYLVVTKQSRKTPIPFGPFLALGAVAAFVYLNLYI